MPTLTITFGEMTPVDKYEEKEGGARCPLPTQDPDLNAKNKERAAETADYRNPSEDGSLDRERSAALARLTTRPRTFSTASTTNLEIWDTASC